MPLPDGTNVEREDVSPPLDWKTKDDIKDVVLHQMHGSPPCVKIRVFLSYYQVPFTVINKKAGGDYKKIPVLKASGRQINDSLIIFKNIVPVLCGEAFAEEWQDKITYKLQPSIEAEAFEFKGDMYKFIVGIKAAPACLACCVGGYVGRKIAKGVRKKNPDMGTSAEIAKQFAAAMQGKQFFGGDKPGQVDIAYYGTMLPFVYCATNRGLAHLKDSGLWDWWTRMEAVMPDVMTKK